MNPRPSSSQALFKDPGRAAEGRPTPLVDGTAGPLSAPGTAGDAAQRPALAAGRAALRRQPLAGYRYVRWRWRLAAGALDAVGALLVALVRRLRSLLGAARVAPPADRGDDAPRTILLVQLDHLGDAVLTTAMLPALRRQWPEASIEVLASQSACEPFRLAPEVDRVHVARLHRFARWRPARWAWPAGMIAWGCFFRRRGVDLAIDVRGDLPIAVLLWLTGARRRVGWTCGGGGFLLTHSPAYVPHRPEIESRRALLEAAGVALPTDQPLAPACRAPAAVRQRIARQLARAWPHGQQADPQRPCVVLHVGAGTAAKRWPTEHWRRLARGLVRRHNAQLILVGTAAERPAADAVAQVLRWPQVRNWAGRLSLEELAAVMESARLVVGADSGPAHLAAAVGTPLVVLFSGTNDLGQWCPPGRDVAALRHPVACSPCHRRSCPLAGHPCLENLQPEQVMAAAAEFLDPRSLVHDVPIRRGVP